MFEQTFEVNKHYSKEIERAIQSLTESGRVSGYYFEYINFNLYLKIYSDSPSQVFFHKGAEFLSVTKISDDWLNLWAMNYNGCELTDEIYVVPEGKDLPEKPYKHIIKIDPLDAFGDGHHPTTKMCASLIKEHISKNGSSISMLDAGTGSGILSIVAWIYGIRDINLFDYDAKAVEKSKQNLMLNGIDSIEPFIADIYSFSSDKRYDLIVANLLSKIIEDNIVKFKDLLSPEGYMILSGISTLWREDMESLFSSNGFELRSFRKDDQWCAFMLQCTMK